MWVRTFFLAITVLYVITSVAHATCPVGLSTTNPLDYGTRSGLPNYLSGTTELEIVGFPNPETYYDVSLDGNCGTANASWTAQLSNCSDGTCTLSVSLPAIDDIPRIDANLCAIVARFCFLSNPAPVAIGVLDRQTSSSVSSLLAYSVMQPTYSSNTDVTLRDLISNNLLQGGTGGDFICTSTERVEIARGQQFIHNCSCADGNPDCFSSILSSVPWSVIQWNGRNLTRSPNDADPVADPTPNPTADPIADPQATIPLSTPTTTSPISPIPSPSLEPTSTASSLIDVSSIGLIATMIVIMIALMQ